MLGKGYSGKCSCTWTLVGNYTACQIVLLSKMQHGQIILNTVAEAGLSPAIKSEGIIYA